MHYNLPNFCDNKRSKQKVRRSSGKVEKLIRTSKNSSPISISRFLRGCKNRKKPKNKSIVRKKKSGNEWKSGCKFKFSSTTAEGKARSDFGIDVGKQNVHWPRARPSGRIRGPIGRRGRPPSSEKCEGRKLGTQTWPRSPSKTNAPLDQRPHSTTTSSTDYND